MMLRTKAIIFRDLPVNVEKQLSNWLEREEKKDAFSILHVAQSTDPGDPGTNGELYLTIIYQVIE